MCPPVILLLLVLVKLEWFIATGLLIVRDKIVIDLKSRPRQATSRIGPVIPSTPRRDTSQESVLRIIQWGTTGDRIIYFLPRAKDLVWTVLVLHSHTDNSELVELVY